MIEYAISSSVVEYWLHYQLLVFGSVACEIYWMYWFRNEVENRGMEHSLNYFTSYLIFQVKCLFCIRQTKDIFNIWKRTEVRVYIGNFTYQTLANDFALRQVGIGMHGGLTQDTSISSHIWLDGHIMSLHISLHSQAGHPVLAST